MPILGSRMTKNRVHNPYTLRTHPVVTRGVAILLATTLGTATQAGAWEEFRDRCLTPLENGFPYQVENLNPVALPGLAEGETAFSGLQSGAILFLEAEPEDGFAACRVFQPEGPAVVQFEDWASEQLANERYVNDLQANDGADVALLSNLWVEPVIGVQLRRSRGGVEMRALETELES